MAKGISLRSIPYYIDLLGYKTKDGTELKHSQVLLLGLIVAFSVADPERGCWATTDYMGKLLHRPARQVRDDRSILIRAGLITVKKNKYGEITNMYPVPIQLGESSADEQGSTPTALPQQGSTPTVHPQQGGIPATAGNGSLPQQGCSTEARPLSDNIIDNINNYYPEPQAVPCPDQPAGPGSPIDLVDESSSKSNELSGFDEDPFNDATKVSVKNSNEDAQKENRRAGAVASKLRKACGLMMGAPSGRMVNAVKKLLRSYTEEQLEQYIEWTNSDEFWQKLPPESRLVNKGLDQWQLTLTGTKIKSNMIKMESGGYFRVPEM